MDVCEQFMQITGLSIQEAKNYLMITGNDIDMATEMFFQEDPQQSQQDIFEQQVDVQDYMKVLWPKNGTDIPNSWMKQSLKLSGIGFEQQENGPCCPLSIINCVVISNLLKNNILQENNIDNIQIEDKYLVESLISILSISYSDFYFIAIKFNNIVNFNQFQQKDDAYQYLLSNIDQYKNEGGLALFLYSLIKTKGIQNITGQLIFQPYYFSGVEMISLMLQGKIVQNIDQFDLDLQIIEKLQNPLQIGLLRKSDIPVNDAFFSPQNKVWIIQGSDHYTLLFNLQCNDNVLYHYNGLKPNGPKLTKIQIQFDQFLIQNLKSKDIQYYKQKKGEIDCIIQVVQSQKKLYPKQFKKWIYEIALTIDDESVQGLEKPLDKIQILDQGENIEGPWRCLVCFNKRFQTYCFGQNENGQICKFCNQNKEECGWSIFLKYDDLPKDFQRQAQIDNGLKILEILETKWTNCQIQLLNNDTCQI